MHEKQSQEVKLRIHIRKTQIKEYLFFKAKTLFLYFI